MKKTPIVILVFIALILILAFIISYKNRTLGIDQMNTSENSMFTLSMLEI